ncbi:MULTISPECIES: LysE family transporter [unclassified Streptomyces]|uniref:LysE family transporter n=1 Tax=unclassified Streptomyces TaxID=2593676 RepID=UPI000369E750|nr:MULTISPECIES: LysE family transporter [unclassified Streptomyces]MYT32010.1 LysE family transporter [Streptomyces sp. SID8354]
MAVSALVSDALLPGLWAGYALAVPVGALAVLLVSLTARTSLRVGASAALGVATADGLYAGLAVLGGAALSRAVQPVAGPLRWVAAAVLLGLATRTALTAVRERGSPPDATRSLSALGRPGRAYLGFLCLTLLNPWTIVYFSALVLAGHTEGNAPARATFVAAVIAASASWQLLLATGGAVLGRALTGPRGRLVTALVSSAVIGALAVSLTATP